MAWPVMWAALALGAPAPIRLAYNYCTLSYTFAYYSDEEWDAEIERLARAGYNVALVTDGTFKVWQEMLRQIGCDEATIRDFIPDECARAWWLMGNLAGEGGPLDQATIDADGERGRRICAKMREHGIEPVLQGYFGMVPGDSCLVHRASCLVPSGVRGQRPRALQGAAEEKSTAAPAVLPAASAIIPQGKWGPYERPPLISPLSPEFAYFAKIWYECLERVYGIKPKYLAGDLFHEGGNTGGIDVTAATRAVQTAQQAAFPGVTWVVQAWQANPTPEVRAGLDPRYTLVEALVKDMGSEPRPFDFGGLPWIWCEVLNFGGNHGLYGNLKTFSCLVPCATCLDDGESDKARGTKHEARSSRSEYIGYGSLSEGYFTNPVCSDLFEEMMMREPGCAMSEEELAEWLENWIARRYGFRDERISEAWRILAETVYACNRCQEGTVENVLCAEPSWDADNASTWGPRGGLWYDPARLETAAALFDIAITNTVTSEQLANFCHDRYDIRRQVFANKLRALVPSLKTDRRSRTEFLMTAMQWTANANCAWSGVPAEFRLATQEERARRRAGERGVKAFRRMVTTWANPAFGRTTLSDYANREYPELIRDYYLPRWEKFLSDAEDEAAAPTTPFGALPTTKNQQNAN